jgi:aminoglycoside/choline kinase family phosphotransferase
MEETLKKILQEKLSLVVSELKITKLFGHASYRTYYRLSLSDGKTYIVMQMPPGKSSVSEEITNYQGPKDELPFLNVQRYLKEIGLPVPAVYAWSPEDRLMVLEDLGDRLLETYLNDTTELLRISFYKRAVDLLVQLQKKTKGQAPQGDGGVSPPNQGTGKFDCIAFHRSFDETLLNWEFDHFLEYGIEDRFKVKIPEAEKNFFIDTTRKISKEIISSPYGFTHRDYQSRNLILKNYELYLLDFQDALRGPEPYDLVALLRDSYIELSWKAVDQLIAYYLEKREEEGIPAGDPPTFRRLFDLVTLQRKLKDTGRFQFIHTVKGNPNFLVSVPASLRYVKEAFSHLPELESLREWIAKYVQELK